MPTAGTTLRNDGANSPKDRHIEDNPAGAHADASVAVIVPPVVCHNLDPHTGIPFMPHMAAHFAGALRALGWRLQVIDCFGTAPHRRTLVGEFMLMGSTEDDVIARLSAGIRIAFIYCRTVAEFIAVERLIDAIRTHRPDVKIALFENVQAVTSYALKPVASLFLKRGCDAVITGEPETRAGAVAERMMNAAPLDDVPGVVCWKDGEIVATQDAEFCRDLDDLPRPAWELFDLHGYWSAGFAHAPVDGRRRFLPILTSRGCPYRCTFCIAPTVNPTWRAHSADRVADDMQFFYETMGIEEFHVSDLDPTVSDKRTREISRELIARALPVQWKLAQGTKIETIKSGETLELMKRAGCTFISFSPESGSTRMLKIMNKPFDHAHGLRMAEKMHALGIRSQAVFLAGVPGEQPEDRRMSADYARKLVRAGVDEISLVIFTPLPGAALADAITGYSHYSACTPSPNWREDYAVLTRYRYRMYWTLFSEKLRAHPRKFFTEIFRLMIGRFETKMEMSLFKQIKLYLLYYAPWLFRWRDRAPAAVMNPGRLHGESIS